MVKKTNATSRFLWGCTFVVLGGILVLSLLAIYGNFFSSYALQERALRRAQSQVQRYGGTLSMEGFSGGPTPSYNVAIYTLDFNGVPITDRQFASLESNLRGITIRQLVLTGTKVTDASIEVLGRLRLKYATIDITNSSITQQGELKIRQLLPFAGVLNVSGPNSLRHKECVDLTFSNSGTRMASVENSLTRIFDLETMAELAVLPGGKMGIFSASDKLFAVVGTNESSVWSMESLQRIASLPAADIVAFSASSEILYTSVHGEIMQYSLPDGKLRDSFRSWLIGRSYDAKTGSATQDLSDVFHPDLGRNVGSFNLPSRRQSASERLQDSKSLLVVSADATRIAWCDNQATNGLADGSVVIFDLISRDPIKKIRPYVQNYPNTGMFDSLNRRLAVGSSSAGTGFIRVFDLQSGKTIFQEHQEKAHVLKVAISANGDRVAAAFNNGLLRWWPIGADASTISDLRDMQHPLKVSDATKQSFEELVSGIAEVDATRLKRMQQWYSAQLSSYPREQLLELSLRHTDIAVRRIGIQSLFDLSLGRSVLSEAATNRLLQVVEDDREDNSVRLVAVDTLLWGSDRKKLASSLMAMDEDKAFAIPAMIKFIDDKSHWAAGAAYSAPIEIVELIESWGPAAKEAVPSLVLALEHHPNKWNFAPAVAKALGAMESDAEIAIPALQEASKRTNNYSSLRMAAEEALQRIQSAASK